MNPNLPMMNFHISNDNDLVRGLDSFPCVPGGRWMNQGFSYAFLLVESIATG